MARGRLIPSSDLCGLEAKLERANECIRDLDSEIVTFLRKPKGGFSQNKEKALHQFLEHARRQVPPKFAVLTGGVCHDLRSALNQLAWLLTSERYRRDNETLIEFPICVSRPAKPRELSRYNGKIEGIASSAARSLVEKLQPYNAPEPANDPLAILHDLNRVDKHQKLVFINASYEGTLSIPLSSFTWTIIGMPDFDYKALAEAAAKNKPKFEFSLVVAFAEFGKRKNQPVIPSLTQLVNFTGDVVRQFSEL
jgi:hypothetical protein